MKRTKTFFPTAVLLTGFLPAASGVAQESPARPTPQVQEASADKPPVDTAGDRQPGSDASTPRARGRRIKRSGVHRRRYIAQIARLHNVTKAKLDLSPKQEEAIGRLFKDYLRAIRDRRNGHRPFRINAGDENQTVDIRAKLLAARKAGDDAQVRKLRKEFRGRLRVRQTSAPPPIGLFIDKVLAELSEKQRPVFRKLVATMRIDASDAPPRNGGLKRLWRAVMRPEVHLANEQRRNIGAILRKGFASVAQARRDGKDAARVAEGVRRVVLEQLSAGQRVKVEALLAERTPHDRTRGPVAPPDARPHRDAVDVDPREETQEPLGHQEDTDQEDDEDEGDPDEQL